MYYEEKYIDGFWYYRGEPREEFKKFTESMLHSKIKRMDDELRNLRMNIRNLRNNVNTLYEE